jgi:branched-chain amino acid transport system permease protein
VTQAANTSTPTASAAAPFNWQKYGLYAVYAIAILLFLLWFGSQLQGMRPARAVQTTITGLLVGGVYALVALGIVIINKASGVFNFAHGYMMFFGALVFFSFFTATEVSVLAALVIATLCVVVAMSMNGWRRLLQPRTLIIAMLLILGLTFGMTFGGIQWQFLHGIVGGATLSVLLGLVIERFAIRPLIGQPLFALVLMTLAIERVLSGATQLVWGSIDRSLPIFTGLTNLGLPNPIRIDGEGTWLDGRINIRTELVLAFLLALIAFAVFVLFFRYTSIGLSMRATAENQQLAQSVGLRVRIILATAWAIASILAMTAGVLQGGATSLGRTMPALALAAFPAVLLGGLESIAGALVGGLVIGVVQVWADLLLPGTQAGTELAPYALLMIVLILRPEGLFGQRRIDRI